MAKSIYADAHDADRPRYCRVTARNAQTGVTIVTAYGLDEPCEVVHIEWYASRCKLNFIDGPSEICEAVKHGREFILQRLDDEHD